MLPACRPNHDILRYRSLNRSCLFNVGASSQNTQPLFRAEKRSERGERVDHSAGGVTGNRYTPKHSWLVTGLLAQALVGETSPLVGASRRHTGAATMGCPVHHLHRA